MGCERGSCGDCPERFTCESSDLTVDLLLNSSDIFDQSMVAEPVSTIDPLSLLMKGATVDEIALVAEPELKLTIKDAEPVGLCAQAMCGACPLFEQCKGNKLSVQDVLATKPDHSISAILAADKPVQVPSPPIVIHKPPEIVAVPEAPVVIEATAQPEALPAFFVPVVEASAPILVHKHVPEVFPLPAISLDMPAQPVREISPSVSKELPLDIPLPAPPVALEQTAPIVREKITAPGVFVEQHTAAPAVTKIVKKDHQPLPKPIPRSHRTASINEVIRKPAPHPVETRQKRVPVEIRSQTIRVPEVKLERIIQPKAPKHKPSIRPTPQPIAKEVAPESINSAPLQAPESAPIAVPYKEPAVLFVEDAAPNERVTQPVIIKSQDRQQESVLHYAPTQPTKPTQIEEVDTAPVEQTAEPALIAPVEIEPQLTVLDTQTEITEEVPAASLNTVEMNVHEILQIQEPTSEVPDNEMVPEADINTSLEFFAEEVPFIPTEENTDISLPIIEALVPSSEEDFITVENQDVLDTTPVVVDVLSDVDYQEASNLPVLDTSDIVENTWETAETQPVESVATAEPVEFIPDIQSPEADIPPVEIIVEEASEPEEEVTLERVFASEGTIFTVETASTETVTIFARTESAPLVADENTEVVPEDNVLTSQTSVEPELERSAEEDPALIHYLIMFALVELLFVLEENNEKENNLSELEEAELIEKIHNWKEKRLLGNHTKGTTFSNPVTFIIIQFYIFIVQYLNTPDNQLIPSGKDNRSYDYLTIL